LVIAQYCLEKLYNLFFNKRRVCDFCYSELKQGQGEQQQQQQHCVLEEEGQQDHKHQEGSATSKPNGLLSLAVPPLEGKHAAATAAAATAAAATTAAATAATTASTGEEDDEDEDVVTEICDNLEVDKQATG
jgi:hypothetical protein